MISAIPPVMNVVSLLHFFNGDGNIDSYLKESESSSVLASPLVVPDA
jgi:hypothetical protein